jgi:hypothetical protein
MHVPTQCVHHACLRAYWLLEHMYQRCVEFATVAAKLRRRSFMVSAYDASKVHNSSRRISSGLGVWKHRNLLSCYLVLAGRGIIPCPLHLCSLAWLSKPSSSGPHDETSCRTDRQRPS